MIFGIFTKPQHVEKIVNFLNLETNLKYVISTKRWETEALIFDIGISYCFPWIINLHTKANKGRVWYNYHPAPLPECRGVNSYSKGLHKILRGKFPTVWRVTLHRMTDKVDAGPIISEKAFPLYSIPSNTQELGDCAHYHLFQLFKESIVRLTAKPLTGTQWKNMSPIYPNLHKEFT